MCHALSQQPISGLGSYLWQLDADGVHAGASVCLFKLDDFHYEQTMHIDNLCFASLLSRRDFHPRRVKTLNPRRRGFCNLHVQVISCVDSWRGSI